MDKNIDENDYLRYYNYVKEQMSLLNSSGSKLSLSKIENEIDVDNLQLKDIRRLCELVQFVRISEKIERFALYHEWYRHFR